MRPSYRILATFLFLGALAAAFNLFLRLHQTAQGPEPARHMLAAVHQFEYIGTSGVVLQHGAFDCGPAALKMVLDYYRIPASLESLKSEMLDDPRGTTMARMSLVARRMGLIADGRRVDEREFSTMTLPSIALFERRHYVVVSERMSGGYVTLLDPSLGRCRARQDTFLRACRGEFLVIKRAL
jgi:ABC-type bacteriocin/lantibiotic exporter with double-glycine peptidase domain